ncbi:hypothetical protein RhiirA5_504138 [Rhizophagus irregularis]|uniref:Uncharacterized protein n=1 Tax=Rhizophagus irregularis TaxID=588596 RepID=A0A2N0P615_9GLOM|nr:hypothetical protein RhiirA5_504138 [Rhizophagus irregularis]
MNEKIIKTISIKMKGKPDNNDGYNIYLSTAKDRLPETLSNFLNIYDIDSNIIKILKAMNSILQSNTLCTFKHNSFASNLMINNNNTHDDDDAHYDENNLPNVLDQLVSESDDKFELEHNPIKNSFFDIVNHDVSVLQRVYYIKLYFFLVIFDEYTQKEHQKSNNKAANNPKNFVVEQKMAQLN